MQQQSNAAQPPTPPASSPAADAEEEEEEDISALKQALQAARKNIHELASNNTNLMKEKLQFEQNIRQTLQEYDSKYTYVINEIRKVDEDLKAAQTNRAKNENERLQAALNKVTSTEKEGRIIRAKLVSKLRETQQNYNEQRAEMMRKEKRMTSFKSEMLALTKEHIQTMIKMNQKEDEHHEKERQWKLKCEALEVRLREERAEREAREKVRLLIFKFSTHQGEK